MKVKRCKLEVVFDVWEDELEVTDVPKVIEESVDHAGYSLSECTVVSVTEEEVEEN